MYSYYYFFFFLDAEIEFTNQENKIAMLNDIVDKLNDVVSKNLDEIKTQYQYYESCTGY